jgi:hypothetical protein
LLKIRRGLKLSFLVGPAVAIRAKERNPNPLGLEALRERLNGLGYIRHIARSIGLEWTGKIPPPTPPQVPHYSFLSFVQEIRSICSKDALPSLMRRGQSQMQPSLVREAVHISHPSARWNPPALPES